MESDIKNFYDLKVWKDAHGLVIEIYDFTKKFPKDEQFGLISQMRRAASSVTANIAEGFGRFHYNDKVKFYQQGRASAVELQNHILLSRDLKYLDVSSVNSLFEKTMLVLKEINGLINAIRKQKNLNS